MYERVITIDIDRPYTSRIPSVQCDSGRKVKVKLTNQGKPLDLTGTRVVLACVKPDGREIFNDTEIVDAIKGEVSFSLTEQINAEVGQVRSVLKLYDGSMLVTSKEFHISVCETVGVSIASSSNELNALTKALNDVQDIDNRFAQTNAQLSWKANDNEVVKKGYGTLNDFDEETRRAIQGLSDGEVQINAVLGHGNVNNYNLANKAVSTNKTDFIEETTGSPFSEDAGAKDGYKFSGSSEVEDSNYICSGYIQLINAISPVQLLCYYRVLFFNEDKNYIGAFGSSDTSDNVSIDIGAYEVLSTATYIRICVLKSKLDDFYVTQSNTNLIQSNFLMPKLQFSDKQKSEMSHLAELSINGVLDDKLGYEAKSGIEIKVGYCLQNSEVEKENINFFITDYISAKHGDTIKIPTMNGRVNVYGASKNYLGGWNVNGENTLEIVHSAFDGCAYIRVSAPKALIDTFTVSINNTEYWVGESFFTLKNLKFTNEQISTLSVNVPIYGDNLDITDIVVAGGKITLGKGIFLLDNVTLPIGTIIEGMGNNTVVKFKTDLTGTMLTLNSNCELKNLVIDGGNTTIPTVNSVKGNRRGIEINNKTRILLSNVTITGFSEYGLYVTHIGYNHGYYRNLKLNNVNCEFNYVGIMYDTRAEYIQTNNSVCSQNFIGCINRGGNNLFTNCMFNRNVHGYMVEGGSEYSNHGHSSASNCCFNHNYESGLIAKNVTIGYIFNGCQLFDGDLVLENSAGIQFTCGEIGTIRIVVNGGNYNLIKDNFCYTNPSFDITSSKTVFEGNRNANGIVCQPS